MHLQELVRELAIILGIAGVVSVVFHLIRQPVVLGYICAGSIAASLLKGSFPGVATLAELGVIFLMFSLGLEFSFRKVARLGPNVAFAAAFEVFGMFFGGAWLGSLLGWSGRDSFFLGGMLSISSTTIIVKAFEEFSLKSRRFAQFVLGILVFEDLLAILMLVVLSKLSSGQEVSSFYLGQQLVDLVLFIGGWFLIGTFVLPRVLRRVATSNSEEMLMIVSVGLCLTMCLLATGLGYSASLGAFLMGSILAESSESHRIEMVIKPLKNLFAAIFFVSVGILIDLSAITRNWDQVLIFSGFVLFGKFFLTTIGSLLAGKNLKTSILVGGSVVQIGEFSFIMAALGVSLGTLSPDIQPIIVAVSVLTTIGTPFVIRKAPLFVRPMERLLPRWVLFYVEQYASWSERRGAEVHLDSGLKRALWRWVISGFIVTLTIKLTMRFASPWSGILIGVLISPFLWVFVRGITVTQSSELRFQVLSTISQGFAVVVAALLAWPFFRETPVLWAVVVAFFLVMIRLFGKFGQVYEWFEQSFLANLRRGKVKSSGRRALLQKFAPWEGELTRLKMHTDSELVGKRIEECDLRSRFSLNVVAIQRGSRLMVAPAPSQQLFPKDEILVFGEEQQVEKARAVIERGSLDSTDEMLDSLERCQLRAFQVSEKSPARESSIRNSGIRDRFGALVVGIERNGRRFMNPDSSERILLGDTVWVVGETQRLEQMLEALFPA